MKRFNRPSVTQYILLRMSSLAIVLLLGFYILLKYILHRDESLDIDLLLLALAMGIIMLAQYFGAKRVEKKLHLINESLSGFKDIEKFSRDDLSFTKEFDQINKNLSKVLQNAKKREQDKQKYNTKLKLKNRQRSDMLSAIAHEFRNPISAIMGYAQTLHEDEQISRLLQEKFLEKIYSNGQKIENLLSRIILWNKFESGKAKLKTTHFDLLLSAQESVSQLQEKYKNRTIFVVGESRIVQGDKTLIEIVLQNLLENALKYSQHEVRIEIQKERIVVIDKGVGISQKDIEKVTKKFYRSGTHSWDNSMGLGLSIVKTILALHNSALEIESQEEKGSIFSFKL